MGMEQLGGVRVLIDRLGLPPRLDKLVREIEETDGPIEKLGETPGADEVRKILMMVDGQTLCACITAHLLNYVELDEETLEKIAEAEKPKLSLFERWSHAAEAFPDHLVLLKADAGYVAFDWQAERITNDIEEHHGFLDGHTVLSLLEQHQANWVSKIERAGLDVLLVEEDSTSGNGYSSHAVEAVVEDPPIIEQPPEAPPPPPPPPPPAPAAKKRSRSRRK